MKNQRLGLRGAGNPQPKTVQRQPVQPVPHINQHSVQMQRVAQAKMAQTRTAPPQAAPLRGAPQLKRPNLAVAQPKLRNVPVPSRPAGVVQRAECLKGIGEMFSSCWRGLTSCWPGSNSSRRDQYQELPDRGTGINSSSTPSSVVVSSSSSLLSTPVVRMTLVDEEDTVNNMTYPRAVNAGLITSCALVLFCWDDSFDCYHAKGGNYKDSHRLRSNPTQIHYVYMVSIADTSATVEEYQRNANLFRRLAGNMAPITFRGQTDINHNILLDVHSMTDVRAKVGRFA